MLQACVLAVRLDINETLPINGLPLEVLSHTFELACSPLSATAMAFVVALTHVCRYRRSLLLFSRKIWTNIFARRDSIDFFSECLSRNGGTSPTLELALPYGVGRVVLLMRGSRRARFLRRAMSPHPDEEDRRAFRTIWAAEAFTIPEPANLLFPDPMTPSLGGLDEAKSIRFFPILCRNYDRSGLPASTSTGRGRTRFLARYSCDRCPSSRTYRSSIIGVD